MAPRKASSPGPEESALLSDVLGLVGDPFHGHDSLLWRLFLRADPLPRQPRRQHCLLMLLLQWGRKWNKHEYLPFIVNTAKMEVKNICT